MLALGGCAEDEEYRGLNIPIIDYTYHFDPGVFI